MNLSLIPHPDYIPASLNEQALTVANNAHRNQKRWGGQPYIIHPIAVADKLPVHLKVLGYLHDVLEDHAAEYPLTRLSELFPVWVVQRVVVLTKLPDENYDDYILRVAKDPATRLVKIADLFDNLKDIKSGSLRDKYRLALRLMRVAPFRKPEVKDTKLDVSMLVGSHTGKRLNVRGTCEKCGTPTNWVVDVMGRVGAYWCGCGN